MPKKNAIEHATLLVLSLLSSADLYGYQMITELERRSDDTFHMKEGTLYPILHGLEKNGDVESYRQTAPSGRERKYYHLTRKGALRVKSETKEWQTYAAAVNAVLNAVPEPNYG